VPKTSNGWESISIITTGDAATDNLYQMVGVPDGLGAIAGRYDEDDQTYVADKAFMTVFMNHELLATEGIVRAHGKIGAFVSQWSIQLNTLQVKVGQDLIQNTLVWNPTTQGWDVNPQVLARLCSADLPAPTAFYNPATGKGFDGVIFMDGEENGNAGRAWGHVASGPLKGASYELPLLGRTSFENTLANPGTGDKTVVIGLNDSTPGQLYAYIGTKQDTGNPVQRAGLANGNLYGIKVTNGGANYANGAVNMENKGAINGRFTLVAIPTSPSFIQNGAQLQTNSNSAGVSRFARPEDGSWDPNNPRLFYFVTTGANIPNDPPATGSTGQSARLYRLTFDDINNPTAGGAIELIVDRAAIAAYPSPGIGNVALFDNITVDDDGNVIVLEDPGGNAYVAKIWKVNPSTKTAIEIATSDPDRFGLPIPPFTTDEESSGVIEITDIVSNANWFEQGRRYYLADMQAHYPNGTELVEGGQLYMLISPAPPAEGKPGKGPK